MENITKITLKVEDMACEHCKNAIYSSLVNIDGIKIVKVSLEDKTVYVEYDNSLIAIDYIKEKIEDEGYEKITINKI